MNLPSPNKKKSFTYNSSTLSGCVDVIVVEKSDKTFQCSQICLTIGNMKMLNTAEKTITVKVNDVECKHKMKIKSSGVAYFEIHSSKNQQLTDSDKITKAIKKMQINDQKNPFQLFNEKDNLNDVRQIEVSLCADLIKEKMSKQEIDIIFNKYRITYAEFHERSSETLSDPNLMIRIDKQIFDSFLGTPKLLALDFFRKSFNKKRNSIKQIEKEERQNGSDQDLEEVEDDELIPPADMFSGVPLDSGKNEIKFSFKGNFKKDDEVVSRLFFYPYRANFKIIISDIDGTVTKSDFLGHVMPMVGNHWSHPGIADFFSHLSERGYIILYLSARNIGQSRRTKTYLESINQEGATMPDGPVFTSPDGFFSSLNREIILKQPHLFKIKVLQGLLRIFQNGTNNPFYAGFGNRETDAIAYSTIGIETKKIFTINEKSEIKVLKNGDTITFTNLNQTIDQAFPEFDEDNEDEDDFLHKQNRNKTHENVIQQSLLGHLFE